MRLWDFFVQAPQVGASIGKAPIRLNDNAPMSEKLAARIANGETGKFDAELFSFIATDFLNGVQSAFKRSMNHADVRFAYGLQDDAFGSLAGNITPSSFRCSSLTFSSPAVTYFQ